MIKSMNKTLKQSESIQKSAIQYEKKEKPIPSRPLTSEIHLKMKPCWERFEEDKWNKICKSKTNKEPKKEPSID